MSADTWQFLGILVTAVGTLLGIYLGVRQTGRKTRTDAAQGLIDQLQEERGEIRKELNAVQVELRAIRERELIRDDYIQELRNHIREGLPPPPPEWPEGLRRHG